MILQATNLVKMAPFTASFMSVFRFFNVISVVEIIFLTAHLKFAFLEDCTCSRQDPKPHAVISSLIQQYRLTKFVLECQKKQWRMC